MAEAWARAKTCPLASFIPRRFSPAGERGVFAAILGLDVFTHVRPDRNPDAFRFLVDLDLLRLVPNHDRTFQRDPPALRPDEDYPKRNLYGNAVVINCILCGSAVQVRHGRAAK